MYFGKTAFDISSLVKRVTNVDLSVYGECEKIQSDFDGDVPLRLKRLSKDPRSTLDAKRGLNFGGPGSSSHQEELQGKVAVSVVHAIPLGSPGLSPTPFGVTNLQEFWRMVLYNRRSQSC